MSVTIYHNPACGTSRNTLAMIRQSGVEPNVIEYVKTPPARETLKQLIAAMGVPVRAILREKGTPYKELGLADPKWTDDDLLDFMMAHPDSDQPSDRSNGKGHALMPSLRGRCRSPRQSSRPIRKGRWRGGRSVTGNSSTLTLLGRMHPFVRRDALRRGQLDHVDWRCGTPLSA